MKTTFVSSIISCLCLFSFGCGQPAKTDQAQNDARIISASPTASPAAAPTPAAAAKPLFDAASFAGKPPRELDSIFGTAAEIKKIENGGEYRLYKNRLFPKGAAVRFYNNAAQSFNVILDQPFPTAKQAILQTFGIDVGATPPETDAAEPLTEKYRGTFGGVKYAKISAKKADDGDGFIFVLAETAP